MSKLTSKLCNALSQEYIGRLRDKNILTTTDIVSLDPEEIVKLTEIPYKEIVAIRNVILAKYAAFPISGYDLYKTVVSTVSILSTGLSSIDDVLEGGLYTGEVTEIVGDTAAGKTQLCFSACASTAVGNKGHVIYVDTGGVFSANRIQQLMRHKGVRKIEDYLSKIQCYHTFTLFEVFGALEDIQERLGQTDNHFHRDVKLVVLDNVASVIYPLLGGESFSEYQGLVSKLGHMLKSLAKEYPCAVLITNNFVAGENRSRVASLGRVWSHVPHVRIGINEVQSDSQDGTRTVTVMKNYRGPVGGQGHFQITDYGQVK